MRRAFFPTFTPIVDFVRQLTNIHIATKACRGPAATAWPRCLDWATACWQSHVAEMLEPLAATLATMTPPSPGQEVKPTDPYEAIRLRSGHLTNNQPRMDYPRYRREGTPTCSGMAETLIKQVKRRVKGTEKFCNPTQA